MDFFEKLVMMFLKFFSKLSHFLFSAVALLGFILPVYPPPVFHPVYIPPLPSAYHNGHPPLGEGLFIGSWKTLGRGLMIYTPQFTPPQINPTILVLPPSRLLNVGGGVKNVGT